MSRRCLHLFFAVAKGTHHHVCILHRHIQQAEIPGGTVVGDRSFVEVAEVIELMVAGKVCSKVAGTNCAVGFTVGLNGHIIPAAVAAGDGVHTVPRQGVGGIEITVGLLGADNPGNPLLQLLGNGRLPGDHLRVAVGVELKGVAHGLNDLIVIRVHIDCTLMRRGIGGGEGAVGILLQLLGQIFCGRFKVQHAAAAGGNPLDGGGDDLADKPLLPGRPELVAHRHLGERHRVGLIDLLGLLPHRNGGFGSQMIAVIELFAFLERTGIGIGARYGALVGGVASPALHLRSHFHFAGNTCRGEILVRDGANG